MKFIHMADCHVGAWRDPKMKVLTHEAFSQAINESLSEEPDFVLIAGDLFNTAIPGIDSLKVVVSGLQKLKQANIPVYAIAGSHDSSPSGKTMLDVLEEAILLRDVMRGGVNDGKLKLTYTEDVKTGVKITGILGRRGSLDKQYYEDLDRASLEIEKGEKIFMFHTSIAELKPKELEKMDAQPASFLPKNQNYYAGGHIHIAENTSLPGYTNIVYPGPLFPASFGELEKLGSGSYCVVEDWKMTRKELLLKPIIKINIDAKNKTPEELYLTVDAALKEKMSDALVLIRLHGEMREGKIGDIDFRRLIDKAYKAGAYFVMKSTTKLTSKEYEEISVATSTPAKIEEQLITGNLGKTSLTAEEERELIYNLMQTLSQETQDGEKKYEYESRVTSEAQKHL
ncbi:DNA repair exonuclease [Candidatus Woesearchaeota archaeon]|nr:DNA repair exonuclease [Candidatus Woesearchaeota archaeon]